MTDQPCPVTGDVPLMKEPKGQRLFSIAVGKYTDEMDLHNADQQEEPQTINDCDTRPAASTRPYFTQKKYSNQLADVNHPLQADANHAVHSESNHSALADSNNARASKKKESDVWCDKISELMLKGWTMLGENCPYTGAVPLMQHPQTKRKFSVATGRYIDDSSTPAFSEISVESASGGSAPVESKESCLDSKSRSKTPKSGRTEQELRIQPGMPMHHLDDAIHVLSDKIGALIMQVGGAQPPLHVLDAIIKCADAIAALGRARREVSG